MLGQVSTGETLGFVVVGFIQPRCHLCHSTSSVNAPKPFKLLNLSENVALFVYADMV